MAHIDETIQVNQDGAYFWDQGVLKIDNELKRIEKMPRLCNCSKAVNNKLGKIISRIQRKKNHPSLVKYIQSLYLGKKKPIDVHQNQFKV